MTYAELHCLSNFSFLCGASHPEELVDRAHALGYGALAITDECSVAGVVRAHLQAKERGLNFIIGSEFTLADGLRVVLLAPDRDAYGDLCELITCGRRAAKKGTYHLTRADLAAHAARCFALWLPDETIDTSHLEWLRENFPDRLWIAVELPLSGRDRARLAALQSIGERYRVPCVAAGGVQMHKRGRKRLHDVLTAIRLGTTVQTAGYALAPNGERSLRSRATLARLFPVELLEESIRIAERCTFKLTELRYEYPDEIVPPGETLASYLRRLTEEGAKRRWPKGAKPHVRAAIEKELALIAELKYEPFFLTVYDVVKYARQEKILCQGRGSAANSVVCFCLGITEVDPDKSETLFERFISKERNEPPDIDVDFEHERREEVIQYVYHKYGRHRAALAATLITYRTRSAVRDVGKALGFSLEQVDRLAKNFQWWDGPSPSFPLPQGEREAMGSKIKSTPLPNPSGRSRPPVSRDLSASLYVTARGEGAVYDRSRGALRAHSVFSQRLRDAGFDARNPRLVLLVELVRMLRGFPRHLSQHVGGFVIARDLLTRLVPIENAAMPERTVIQWDKDDIDALGLLKVDCLGLGMLTVIRKAFQMVEAWDGRQLTIQEVVENEDPAVYEMISHADTVGVFQIESRAQMSMLPRLKPKKFYDLVIEIAIVRPGPIQGNMVHPYLRRRDKLEPESYPSKAVESVLKRTLGVPIFQEQVIKLAMVAAGFSGGEADGLRRAMAAWRRKGGLDKYEDKLINGMRKNGYSERFARQIYEQIKGFGEYGFPESHSASFALLAYTSAWLKRYHPAVFLAALLNSQPMGFYAPSQLIQDARRRRDNGAGDVNVLPVDVRYSDWDCTLERGVGMAAVTDAGTVAQMPKTTQIVGWIADDGEDMIGQFPAIASLATAPPPSPSPWKGEGEGGGSALVFSDTTVQRFPSTSSIVAFGKSRRARADTSSRTTETASAQPQPAVRLGLRHVKGLSEAGARRLVEARARAPFESVLDMTRRARLDRRDRDALASAGALKGLAGHRHRARWAVAGIEPERPLLAQTSIPEAIPLLRAPTEGADIVADYAHLGFTLGRHPLALLRRHLARLGSVPAAAVHALPHGRHTRTAGIVVCRQHPGSAKGVIFLTLEDETGHTNVIVWPKLVERYQRVLTQARLIFVDGEVQREGEVLHVVARRLEDRSALLGALVTRSRDFH